MLKTAKEGRCRISPVVFVYRSGRKPVEDKFITTTMPKMNAMELSLRRFHAAHNSLSRLVNQVSSGVALQSFKATRALKVKEHPYGMERRHSFAARSFSSDTDALLQITDPDVKQAIKNILASSWDELRDSIKSDVMYALSKETDDMVQREALANAWRAAEAVEQFGGVLFSLRMELDELSGSSGENVRPLSDELQGALRAAYRRYNTYLDTFGLGEAYLRKKVEIELGTKMIHIKMRCSGLDSEWGKITALGTSGLSGSYIEHRAA